MEQIVQNFIALLNREFECKIIRGNSQSCVIVTAKVDITLKIQALARKQGHTMNKQFHAAEIRNNYTVTAFCYCCEPFLTDRQAKVLSFIKTAKQNNVACYATTVYAAFPDTDFSLIAGDLRSLQGEGHITRA